MKTRKTQRSPFWAALAVVTSLFLALLVTAPGVQANTGAGATILNTVQIDYNDAGGTQSYSANASTYTTVNLVQATLTLKGRPISTAAGTSNPLPSGQTIDSGATATYLISLTSNANGNDLYDLSLTPGTFGNMTSETITYQKVKADGTTTVGGANPAQANIGASVIQASSAGQIKIPGGSLATAGLTGATLTDGRVLVIDGVDYLISSVVAGNAASNTHGGATPYDNLGTSTSEVYDTINLVANPSGAGVSFPGSTVGHSAYEQVLILVTVTGVVGSNHATPGTVPFTLTAASNTVPADTANTGAITTTFNVSTVTVTKTVANYTTAPGVYGANVTGKPGDILEYKIVVNNPGGAAKLVKGADAVPVYTQLVCGSGALGTAACTGTPTTAVIATITSAAGTSLITYQSSDNECSGTPADVGAGDASGFVETSPLHFYMGTGCTASAGGTVAAGATYTILYRVKMN
jgi:hypothetical protein